MKMLAILISGLALSGCAASRSRFVSVDLGVVLDTKTGQYCKPTAEQAQKWPLCSDLAKR